MVENKYQTGKIYKIVDIGYNEMYIGSTTKKLSERFGAHKYNFINNTNRNSCTSKYLFEKYGINNCKIELIENFPCNNREELHKREGYYIQNSINCVNKVIPGRTQKEYLELNKSKIYEYNNNYKKENKEKIRIQQKTRTLCECGLMIKNAYKPEHRTTKKHFHLLQLKKVPLAEVVLDGPEEEVEPLLEV